MVVGTVFDIKEFSIFDGDGMRCTVFLKGCPLKCKWCHNPEGLSPYPEIMVNTSSCINCGNCKIEDCAKINKNSCSACGKCIAKCPGNFRTIKGQTYTASELAEKLNGYSRFFAKDGGITFSGGEPTFQYDFLSAVCDKIKGKTIIETSGYLDEDKFNKLLPKLSSVFIDFKVFDENKHLFYTGVSNKKIKNNIKTLCAGNIPFVVRIPMVKGVNDDRENLENIANFIKDAKNLLRVEILPYNTLAPAKYSMVDRKFEQNFSKPDYIDTEPFLSNGICVKIL